MITLQIVTEQNGRLHFQKVGSVYDSRERAMAAAKKFVGRKAEYWGDGLSIRYDGESGTVYLCEKRS